MVMLQGNFGTGKTLILMEALRIKISQYQASKLKLKVILTTGSKQKALLDFLQNTYHIKGVDIEFYDCLNEVS